MTTLIFTGEPQSQTQAAQRERRGLTTCDAYGCEGHPEIALERRVLAGFDQRELTVDGARRLRVDGFIALCVRHASAAGVVQLLPPPGER